MSAKRSVQRYGNYLLLALGGLLIIHLAVIAGLLPAAMVWGGQYEAGPPVIKMELLASLITILSALIVADFSERLRVMPNWLSKIGMYLLAGMFLLSTLGSISSAHPLERYGMSVYALVLAVLSIQLLRAKARIATEARS